MVSVIGSSAFGVVKKRFQEVNNKQKQKKINKDYDGMPPAYITVESSFDDQPLAFDDEEKMLQICSNLTRKSYTSKLLYKSMLKV